MSESGTVVEPPLFLARSRSRDTPLCYTRPRRLKRGARGGVGRFRAERKTKEYPVRRIARSGVVGHGVSTSLWHCPYSETPLPHVFSLWRATRARRPCLTIIADTSTRRTAISPRLVFLFPPPPHGELFTPSPRFKHSLQAPLHLSLAGEINLARQSVCFLSHPSGSLLSERSAGRHRCVSPFPLHTVTPFRWRLKKGHAAR